MVLKLFINTLISTLPTHTSLILMLVPITVTKQYRKIIDIRYIKKKSYAILGLSKMPMLF